MKIKRIAIITIRKKEDVELFIKGVKSSEPVKLLLNETREKLMNMLRMDEEFRQCLSF